MHPNRCTIGDKNHKIYLKEKIIQIKLIKEEKGVIFDYQDNGKNAIDKTIQPKLVNQLCQQLLVNSIIETQNGFHLNFKLNL